MKVEYPEGVHTNYKIKLNTKFSQLFSAFHRENNTDPSTIRFLFDGKRLKHCEIPDDHGMEDNDVIETYNTQIGGYTRRHELIGCGAVV